LPLARGPHRQALHRRARQGAPGQSPHAGGAGGLQAQPARHRRRAARRLGRNREECALAQRRAARGGEGGMSPRYFLLFLLTLAVLGSGIAVVYARQQHRQAYVELTRLQKQRDELNIEFSRLQLEQATWAETNRIEQV